MVSPRLASGWVDAAWAAPGEAAAQVFAHDAVVFTPLRHWVSTLSGARYPVEWRVQTPAGAFDVQSLLDEQELDSRASTGAIYWEGLCTLHAARARGETLGAVIDAVTLRARVDGGDIRLVRVLPLAADAEVQAGPV